ncbi:MAG: hypothetical protein HY276_09205 [Ignavibacteriales bacterium]|nr:hypothetical protein [Ignavibacteriales bacterium]
MRKLLSNRWLQVAWVLIFAAVAGVLFYVRSSPSQPPTVFNDGDVIVAVGNGQAQWRRSNGELYRTLTTVADRETAGMAFDRTNRKLYVTNFRGDTVSIFDSGGELIGPFGSGYNQHPESILFDRAGYIYVGQPDGNKNILKFDPLGNLLAQFSVATERRGTDWIDLASDQCTMFYTSEGFRIRRYDLCTKTQLLDFTAELHSPAYALRLLSGGGLLVADAQDIHRLDASGKIIKTYDAPGQNEWFALNLDPDGRSFWSADLTTSEIYKFDLISGEPLLHFNAGQGTTVGGLAVIGEFTIALGACECSWNPWFQALLLFASLGVLALWPRFRFIRD